MLLSSDITDLPLPVISGGAPGGGVHPRIDIRFIIGEKSGAFIAEVKRRYL